MLMDKNGKLFGKVSIIDILVVVVILGMAAGVYYKFVKSDTPSVFNRPEKIRSVFYVDEAADFTQKDLVPGVMVREAVQSSVLGTVTAVKTAPSVSYGVNSQGEWKQSTKPGYISLEITLEGEGFYGASGVTFGGSAFYVGKYYEVRFGNVALYGRIKSIEKVE